MSRLVSHRPRPSSACLLRGRSVGAAAAGAAAEFKAAAAAAARSTPDNSWILDLSTGGRVVIQLRPDVAPATVERIKTLTRQGFYNGLSFFRVIEGFMAQGGDPQNNGTGGSDAAQPQRRDQRPARTSAARSRWRGRRT